MSAAEEPLRPLDSDEGPHEPAADTLWNESWYFDFADPGQGAGGWIRLGLYPNEGRAWINALLCGPGLPTIALNDFHARLPVDPADVHTDDVVLTQDVVAPLRSYRVTVAGSAQVYDDPADLLRGAPGRPAEVALDLVWSTDGVPYQYRLATRYEIPCTVSGTVTVDGDVRTFAAVPGQRDHSWGVRDWWAMDWVWSAVHLDDGTHVHAVELRIPGFDGIGIGYVQRVGRPLLELQGVQAREVFADNELPVSAGLHLAPDGLALEALVVAHAPVRLDADDGRVAQFPRAWVSVRTADGRTGVGWMEWNRNR